MRLDPCEEWRAVPGYEGLYEVSDHGRVRSCGWVTQTRNRYGEMHRKAKGQLLKPMPHPTWGHLRVGLRKDGRKHRFMVHRLVALAFLPPAPADKPLVLHRDGNPANNRKPNLYWGDNKDNSQDAVAHGTIVRGEQATRGKLKEHQVREIRQRHRNGATFGALGREYGVTKRAIIMCVKRLSWTHVA